MKHFTIAATAATLALMAFPMGPAFAQGHNNNRYDNHRPGPAMHGPAMHGPSAREHARHNWRKGGHIARNDWGRGRQVDWRRHHLHRPNRGYEWREVDGNYVLAAVATGVIATVILANQ